jgi:hypothetical protein
MVDLLWFVRQAFVLFRPGSGFVYTPVVFAGVVSVVAGLALVLAALWRVCRPSPRPARRSVARLAGALGLAGAALGLVAAGAGAICGGTRFPPPPAGGAVALNGATATLVPGPPDAPFGLLVTVSGYGSQSPAFCEPAELRDATTPTAVRERAGAADLSALFRQRLLVRLNGGFTWPAEARSTLTVAAELDALLRRPELEPLWRERPALVVAHSRGTHVTAATAAFRAPGWTRIAVHPPAGVWWYLRLHARRSPEIAEIHALGGLLAQRQGPEALPAALAPEAWGTQAPMFLSFPWNEVWQARGWDHTVWRFPAGTLAATPRNRHPWGSHSAPFADGASAFWRGLEARLRASL